MFTRFMLYDVVVMSGTSYISHLDYAPLEGKKSSRNRELFVNKAGRPVVIGLPARKYCVFQSIIANFFTPDEGYVHYIITYIPGKSGLLDVQLLFLDKDFDVIDSQSLNEFIVPDYAELTTIQDISDVSNVTSEPNVRSLDRIETWASPCFTR